MAVSGWDEYFGSRRWRVATEVTGIDAPVDADGPDEIRVRFTKGKFEIDNGGTFHSPLSSARGTKGIVLQEVDPATGQDLPGSRVAVGIVVLRRARKEGAVQ